MFAPIRNLGPRRFMKALVALMLCYVMAVESLAAHMSHISVSADGLHQMCLGDAVPVQDRNPPVGNEPSHTGNAHCCLIFGSGDLPRPTGLVSVIVFEIVATPDPSIEFVNLVDQRIIFSQSLPRAPPHFG